MQNYITLTCNQLPGTGFCATNLHSNVWQKKEVVLNNSLIKSLVNILQSLILCSLLCQKRNIILWIKSIHLQIKVNLSRTFYLESGRRLIISWSCWANPISNSLQKKRKLFSLNKQGLEVSFSIHLQSLASKIFFSASKLVRPLANPFQMFGRSAWF